MTDEFALLVAEYAKQDANVLFAFGLACALALGLAGAAWVGSPNWWRKVRRALIVMRLHPALPLRLSLRRVQRASLPAYVVFCVGIYLFVWMVTL